MKTLNFNDDKITKDESVVIGIVQFITYGYFFWI